MGDLADKIIVGDCCESMRGLVAEGVKVQTCVTSPPYFGLRDYGTAKWDGGDSECDHKIPSIEHDPKRGDSYSSASHAVRFNRTECHKCGAVRVDNQIGLEDTPGDYVKKMVEVFGLVRDLLADDGTLWLNLGDSYSGNCSRVSTGRAGFGEEREGVFERGGDGLKPKDLIGIPWRVAFALQADGWYLRQDIIWNKPNPMPESVTDRCTKSHEYIFLLSKSQRYFFDQNAMKEVSVGVKSEKRNKRSVWTVATQAYSGAHFAVFPPALIRPCILAGSRTGDVVLDPFFGSGTTGMVARGFRPRPMNLRPYRSSEVTQTYT